ncbi:MAG: nuclear transport factor 2 family protein [Bacteriovorax sp.]|nr:nuclear transport factor 2 family protein [Bacteriovorax sp.]
MINIKGLSDWYENLAEENLDKMDLFYAENFFFKDPFNEITGREKVKGIFKHMFETLDEPHFVFIDVIIQEKSAFVTWDFIFKIRGTHFKIHGSSHLKYNEDDKIIYHRDYWDVGEELLLKIPVVKSLYGLFRKKLALP